MLKSYEAIYHHGQIKVTRNLQDFHWIETLTLIDPLQDD